MSNRGWSALLCIPAFCGGMNAQDSTKVDFQRDVQPILKANCVGCHGPTQQMNNFRLDRRRDAMRGGTISVISPGSSQSSHLYLRLIGKDTIGMPMPPTGSLPGEQIAILQKWIDEGAVWPDAASGEGPAAAPDPAAMRLVSALHRGDLRAFGKALRKSPKAAQAKGPGGSTPLHYAVLYGDREAVQLLLRSGANPNARNDAGATALMWAVTDLEKTRLLLDAGADPNARSDDGRTPLLIACRRSGGSEVVKLLLQHGANVSVKAGGLLGEVTPLSEALFANDEAIFRLLLKHGADHPAGPLPLALAHRSRCEGCVQELMSRAKPDVLIPASFMVSPPLGPALAAKAFVEQGVDPKAKAPSGMSLLMLAAASEALPVETVRALIEKGADLNAKSPDGRTALDFARRHGQTPVVELLLAAGARPGEAEPARPAAQPAASVRAAVERSIPLVQRTDATFLRKAGCVSCHNNSVAALAVAAAREHGVRVDETQVQQGAKWIGNYIDSWRERALQGVGIPGDSGTMSYLLLGLAAANYPADAATDAMAYFIKNQQLPDGRWMPLAHRPPIEASEIKVTAMALRALQHYAIRPQRAEYERSVRAAAAWLEKAAPLDTQDKAFRLLGLSWAGAGKPAIRAAADALVKGQRPDGGWSQTPTLASDAYATGEALTALLESGALAPSDEACQRASRFLLQTQLADGSWYVRTRAVPLQPYFESDFPHGPDQWISAAATGWATRALARMTPQKRASAPSLALRRP